MFRQEFPCTIPNVATDKWLMSSFPSFEASAAPPFNRTMHFDGTFAHQVEMTDSLADCEIDVQGGVPLALYQASHAGKVGANLIFSQLTKMKTGEMACGRAATELAAAAANTNALQAAAAAAAAATPGHHGNYARCRIVGKKFELMPSKTGYSAYTPAATGSGFDEHQGDYCGCKDTCTYDNLDIILDHFPRIFQLYTAPHAPSNVLY